MYVVLLLIGLPAFVLSWLTSSSFRYPASRVTAVVVPWSTHRRGKAAYVSEGNGEDLTSNSVEDVMGLNELHTMLRKAVQREDFTEAARISDALQRRLYGTTSDPSLKRARRRRMSWKGLGAAPWLTERLDDLNFTFPTTIQINSMEAVNAILNNTEDILTTTSLEERIGMGKKDMGIVVSGTTGSGKTLAYLVPLLSTLSDSLFIRQRIRVGAEELLGDITGDLLDRIAIVTSPEIRSNSRRQLRQNAAIATGAAISSLGKSGSDVKNPLALIVVPSKELGIQTAMLLYQLVGGSVKDSPNASSGRANMFRYKGPKGMRIGCVLDDDESAYGLKLQTDVAIATPQYLGKLVEDADVDPSKLRVIVFDEADLTLEETPSQTLARLFDDNPTEREYSRLALLVGASVTEALGNLAVSSRILPAGKSWIATATRFAALQPSDDIGTMEEPATTKMASLKDLSLCLNPGLRHERVLVPNNTGMLVLTRLLRSELQQYEESLTNGGAQREKQRPRVVVFFPDETEARNSIEPLRDAMWGEHKLCVLLPKTGVNPLTIMDQFKRNETTVMLATPNSVRGLDFPALTHVYTLYLPVDDPREYVHLAGRVGRVGQLGTVLGDGGHVVSVVREEDAAKMDHLAQTLGFEFVDIDPSNFANILIKTRDGEFDPDSLDVEVARRYLEDTITLLDTVADPEIDMAAVEARTRNLPVQQDTDDYDDDDDE